MIVALKKGPIVAVLPYKYSDLEGDFSSINEMHSEKGKKLQFAKVQLLNFLNEIVSFCISELRFTYVQFKVSTRHIV